MRAPTRSHIRFAILISLAIFTVFVVFEDVVSERRINSPKPTKDPGFKRVTKSLADLAKVPDLSDHILMFNRIPNSGGEILVLLLQMLQGGNSFRHIRLPIEKDRMDRKRQKDFANDVLETIRNQAIPLSFDKNVYFTNFTEFGVQSPMHVNIIREPLENIVSRMSALHLKGTAITHQMKLIKMISDKFEQCWLAVKSRCLLFSGYSYEFVIPYFCGHDQECLKPNSIWALNRAKEIVDKYYPVVGLLEHLNDTIFILEHKLPMFFKGASEIYAEKISESHKKWKHKTLLKEIVRDHLKYTLATEYEFYNWIKAKLFAQMKSHAAT